MSANQLLDQSDYQRLAEFRYHLRGFLRFSERAASEMGLRPQQHRFPIWGFCNNIGT
jgi:hypothetical protein